MRRQRSILFYWNLGVMLVASLTAIIYLLNFNAQSWRDEMVLLILPLLFGFYYLGRKYFIGSIDKIKYGLSDADGDSFNKFIEVKHIVELMDISEAINAIKKNVIRASRYVKGIEEGELDIKYSNDDEEDSKIHDPLKNALLSMSSKMKTIADEDKERNWIAEGLARFIDLLRADNQDLKTLSDKIISNLVKYTGVNQGGLFIVQKEHEGAGKDQTWLELVACYAYDRQKFLKKRVGVGEGLLGQIYLEKETTYLKAIPEDYINITSGLGEAPPTHLLIVPLKLNDEVYGLIELAAFKELPSYKVELIERLCENIASTVSNTQITERTNRLLKDSQQQTEELRAQEEEMRQNQEELQATQEAIERKQKELEASQQRSTAIFENSRDAILVADVSGMLKLMNSSAKELFKVDDFNMTTQQLQLQRFIKKFDIQNPDFFHKKKRRTKATDMEKNHINVEVYLSKEKIGGHLNYLVYIRDITEDIKKENYIAENLMELDELRAELHDLKSSQV